jgi:hypothetical protein
MYEVICRGCIRLAPRATDRRLWSEGVVSGALVQACPRTMDWPRRRERSGTKGGCGKGKPEGPFRLTGVRTAGWSRLPDDYKLNTPSLEYPC